MQAADRGRADREQGAQRGVGHRVLPAARTGPGRAAGPRGPALVVVVSTRTCRSPWGDVVGLARRFEFRHQAMRPRVVTALRVSADERDGATQGSGGGGSSPVTRGGTCGRTAGGLGRRARHRAQRTRWAGGASWRKRIMNYPRPSTLRSGSPVGPISMIDAGRRSRLSRRAPRTWPCGSIHGGRGPERG